MLHYLTTFRFAQNEWSHHFMPGHIAICPHCGIRCIRPAVIYGAETWTVTNKTEKKNVNDMGEKDTEENIWTNKGEWTVEN